MMNLSLVGLSEDGSALVLSGVDGRRYSVEIDERLRSATRSGRSTQDEPSEAPIGAKEIQSRMRAGATPEEVADSAGWSVDRVTAFAAPVLQERSWMAQRAQSCRIGRGDEDPNLGELVQRRLEERGIEESTTRWDAWLRGDGAWMILLAYPAGQGDRVATWSFDPSTKALLSLDDEARWLTENRIPQSPGPRLVQPASEATDESARERPPAARNHPAGRAKPGPRSGQQPDSPIFSADTSADPIPTNPAQPEAEDPVRKDEPPTWDEVLFGAPPDEPGR